MRIPPKTRPRLFLVDAHALIYRAYFAFIRRPLTNSRGENTSAPFGFTRFLQDILAEHDPDYLAAVFDAGLSFRDEIYPEYKATRERMPDDLRASLGYVRTIIRGFNVGMVELEGYEADDVIGTLARQATAMAIDTVIVSGDKDFYQLLGRGVSLLNPGRGGPTGVAADWVDEEGAKGKFGVKAEQVADYLALVGDSSDNVPGAPGIGPKTASALLARFPDVETIIRQADEVTPSRVAGIIREHADSVLLSKQLVTIRTDLDTSLDLDILRVRQPDVPALREVFTRLEFTSLAEDLADDASEGDGLHPGSEDGTTSDDLAAAQPPVIVTTPAEATDVADSLAVAGRVGVHAETTDEGAPKGELVGLALALDDGRAWYLPFRHESPLELATLGDSTLSGTAPAERPANLPPLADPSMRPLRNSLLSEQVEKVGHNVKRHALILSRAGAGLGGEWYDMMIASYLLDPGQRDHGVVRLALQELREKYPTGADLVGRGRTRTKFSETEVVPAADFACGRARLALRLADRFRDRLSDEGLTGLMDGLEMPLSPILLRMEIAGISLDTEFFAEMRARMVRELARLREAVFDCAGGPFNMNSTPQLRTILFEQLKLPVVKRTKTGPSTDASVLEELAMEGHDLPRLMLEYRELEKLRSTYVEALPALVDERTGRVHTSFNQAVAQTGRLSSSDPNLQNIPIRTELGRKVRRGFVAKADHVFLAVDYSQVELRILAHFSGDRAFVSAFRDGIDIHRQTASVIFGIPFDEVSSEMRDRAKTVNFATLYGQGSFSLARQLGIPRDEAQAFIDTYFVKLDGVRAYLDEQVERARSDGYVETLMGRRRAVPELHSRNWNIRQAGERIAQNTPIQGTAADLMKKAMIDVQRSLDELGSRARMLLQVHDELLLEVPRQECDSARDLVVERMEDVAELAVPLVAEWGIGRDWYGCKP